LYIDQHTYGGIDGRDLFDGENRLEKGPSRTTVFDGNLNAHQTEVKQLRNQLRVEVLLLVHGANLGRNIFLSKLAHRGTKELFFFRQQGKGRSGLRSKNGISHANKLCAPMRGCPAPYMGNIGLGTASKRGTGRARRK